MFPSIEDSIWNLSQLIFKLFLKDDSLQQIVFRLSHQIASIKLFTPQEWKKYWIAWSYLGGLSNKLRFTKPTHHPYLHNTEEGPWKMKSTKEAKSHCYDSLYHLWIWQTLWYRIRKHTETNHDVLSHRFSPLFFCFFQHFFFELLWLIFLHLLQLVFSIHCLSFDRCFQLIFILQCISLHLLLFLHTLFISLSSLRSHLFFMLHPLLITLQLQLNRVLSASLRHLSLVLNCLSFLLLCYLRLLYLQLGPVFFNL